MKVIAMKLLRTKQSVSIALIVLGISACSGSANQNSSTSAAGVNNYSSNISKSATMIKGSFQTSVKGTYLSAEDLEPRAVKADRTTVLDWETLTVVDKNGGKLLSGDLVYLRTYTGYFIQVTNGNSEALNAASPNSDSWEQFAIISKDGSEIKSGSVVGFRSTMTGKFITAWNGGGEDARVSGVKLDTWEMFKFQAIGETSSAQTAPAPTTPVTPAPSPVPSPVPVPVPAVPAPSTQPVLNGSLFGDRSTQLDAAISQADSSNPENARRLRYIAAQPTSAWFGGWNADVESDLRGLVARANGSYANLVLYNIPNRDCGQHSAGGVASLNEYKAWIDKAARGIGNGKVIVVIEPDAVTLQDCLSGTQLDERFQALIYAITQLKKNPSAKVYLDAGNSDWLVPDEAANRLKRSGIASADGFALNVSNFRTTESTAAYGQKISALVNGKTFVIDTSRNGNGPLNSEWCNPRGRALGRVPTLNTGISKVDALLWIKRPGESDGECNGGPAAGSFWLDYALELAINAKI
ncbi:MAG: endoglucanase [Proteobacteria bacterium]|nr:MAG: endoglucanase [Pseudomonadota bacterium]